MELSKTSKEMLLKEIQIVKEKMQQEKDLKKKVYFYSAIYGQLERLYNIEYHQHLQFMHLVFSVSYSAIQNRLNSIAGGDTVIPFPDNFFDEIDKLLGKIWENIKNDEDTYLVLERISNLTYLLNGNGYYLSQKGVKVYSP